MRLQVLSVHGEVSFVTNLTHFTPIATIATTAAVVNHYRKTADCTE
jgi:hypothetical protein